MIRRSAMRDWSSLAPDLIRHVGDLLLSTSDVDGYMDMRAVCHSWRSAVAVPRQHGADDPRFCHRQWVMLDDDDYFYEGRLFVNVSTGRFFRRRLPLLRTGHVLVGASDGLLVLADSLWPHPCRVLNPLTGHTIRFAAPIPIPSDTGTVAVASSSDAPMLLLASKGMCGRPEAMFADPAREYFFSRITDETGFVAAVAYAGHIYMAHTDGSVYRRVGSPAHHGHNELIIAPVGKRADQTEPESVFLVESAGELLLVLGQRQPCVFRVDVERKALDPAATSIGGRALFLGPRSLSVAADKFPNIEGDCLYYGTSLFDRRKYALERMFRFRMRDECEALVSSNVNPIICHPDYVSAYRPLCIARVFLAYCLNLPDVKEQLMSYSS